MFNRNSRRSQTAVGKGKLLTSNLIIRSWIVLVLGLKSPHSQDKDTKLLGKPLLELPDLAPQGHRP